MTGRRRSEEASHLTARPGGVTQMPSERGLQPLSLGDRRDGLLYVPTTHPLPGPRPLLVLLHGAGGEASHSIAAFTAAAEARGLLLLAPDSRGGTWDVILGGYGPDVAFIDRALAHIFARYPVDPARVVLDGFSDGASYALSLGLGNGDLFTHLMAFAPGFMAPAAQVGAPRIFVAHGDGDRVLPIDRCSRVIVPQLRGAGYDVTYREFHGGHTVPREVVEEALEWLEGRAPAHPS
ncbi:alpha/beta hydrolase [Deinococcus planocerae]|uniref:alpha/beta hydrolase n=1 Tax=Deinococcus planocerae TaxID=1737569 RepID=UPI001FEA8CDE|nr:alpha/beta hydrolase [Deinococcus planocerae]